MSSIDQLKLLTHQVVTVALDLLFPPHCVNCERVGSFLCSHCLETIVSAPQRVVPGFDGVQVRAEFEGAMSAAIHALKYERCTRLADPLGNLLCEMLTGVDWPIDLVTPVPLHTTRMSERGYNQSGLLAQVIAQTYGWAFNASAVRRVRETPSQTHLNAKERTENVAGAFEADQTVVAGKNVLLVDDVLTTGATLSSCAGALRMAGAPHVYGVAVAGAIQHNLVKAGTPDVLVDVL